MKPLTNVIRCAFGSGFTILLLVGTFTLGTTQGLASERSPETIQATYDHACSMVSVTLIVDNCSTLSDLRILSQAFQNGQDRGLVTALCERPPAKGRSLWATAESRIDRPCGRL